MNRLRFGVIGCGNMGGAILKGLLPHASVRLLAHDHGRAKADRLNEGLPEPRVEWVETPDDLAEAADIIVLAVKPGQIEAVCGRIRSRLDAGKIVLSVAAAVSMAQLAAYTGHACPVVRSMPNLPALAGKGVFALCLDDPGLGGEKKTLLLDLFGLMGKTVALPEAKFPAFSALAGCGPAYACLLMEGMQNAAIAMGFTAREAKELTAATVEGAARLALESPESFADIRARVCSPAGMTIDAVNHLERTAVRGHVTDAVIKAFERDVRMSRAVSAASGKD